MRDFENSGMVLSEFSGSSHSFSGFHQFNSFVLQDLMQALDSSLSTPPEKKAEMMKLAYKYSSARTFKSWVENFLKDLKQAYSPEQTAQSRFVYLGLSTNSVCRNPEKVVATPLNIGQTTSDFFSCNRCLVFIDHEALPRK
jgi:hypothetical protein